MKREREESCESLKRFSAIEEWPRMLLLANPSPVFVARLLCLSKQMRRTVWDFITSAGAWDAQWHWNFCRHLRSQFPKPPVIPEKAWTMRNMQPIFVTGNGKGWSLDHYFVAKVLPHDKAHLNTEVAALVFGTRHGLTALGEKSTDFFPNWQLRLDVHYADCFYWHFVARAFAAWLDIMVQKNSLACRNGDPEFPADLDLCLL